MGRPRKFDESAVLDAAAREFRVHGFADTSTEQLCDAAGVGRSTLYNTFVSKEELFVRTLERYTITTAQRQADVLATSDATGAERLTMLLDLILAEEADSAKGHHAAGCMTVGTVMTPDLLARDSRIADVLDRDLRHRLGTLEDCVRSGQADGSIVAEVTPLEAAWQVVTVISGIRVSAAAGAPSSVLGRVAHDGIRTLFAID
ncbi:TetR/AcrR family transcriptional repressor of nem operon [Rhodococcus sp. 27YEA15]|uniref:TetR/AcrR family transcriptional regulator n=1 Tax=Rhodococcus sp. 27YEA15 TaxID=3156259 RepID=UPI003C7C2F79